VYECRFHFDLRRWCGTLALPPPEARNTAPRPSSNRQRDRGDGAGLFDGGIAPMTFAQRIGHHAIEQQLNRKFFEIARYVALEKTQITENPADAHQCGLS
jgi:hypothetical protein